ncbi:MAG: IS200/IS605 family transposase [Bacteroidia bacterium]
MPYIRVWVHFVWSTKHREPLLTDKVRASLFEHIKENALSKNIFLAEVNGYTDHIHCLVSLKATQTLAYVAQHIKGESSYWVNSHELTASNFQWQREYYAVSVGESEIGRIRRYIQNQETHHAKQSFDEELETLKKKGFVKYVDGFSSYDPDHKWSGNNGKYSG